MTTGLNEEARIERITVYPVKAFDGMAVDEAKIADGGTLAGDRQYALFGPDDEPVNGKRTDRVHDLATAFDLKSGILSVSTECDDRQFDLRGARTTAEDWFSAFFDLSVRIRHDTETGFVDRRYAGPSVVSTATLEAVASWFDDVTVDELRRRLRPNVEVSGVSPFWEDRFVGRDAPAFVAGTVRFEGVEHCGRCIVPERDPDTGERDPAFRTRFVEHRRASLPEWVDEESLGHHYAVMLIADVPQTCRGETLRTGDTVRVVDDRSRLD